MRPQLVLRRHLHVLQDRVVRQRVADDVAPDPEVDPIDPVRLLGSWFLARVGAWMCCLRLPRYLREDVSVKAAVVLLEAAAVV